jgi:hypothetical protein
MDHFFIYGNAKASRITPIPLKSRNPSMTLDVFLGQTIKLLRRNAFPYESPKVLQGTGYKLTALPYFLYLFNRFKVNHLQKIILT